MADFVFVTAASENHFLESVDAIASVQSIMPTKQIHYFDIGLTNTQIVQVGRSQFLTRFNKIAYWVLTLASKWTRKPLAYLESTNAVF